MKTIVVSGASRGIGFELCVQAQAAGHRVIALSRNISTLEKAGIKAISVDLAHKEGLTPLKNYLTENKLQVDALVNNAGLLENKPFSESHWAVFEDVYRVNVFGLAALTQLVLPYMSPTGHVVMISSMGGIQGSSKFPGLAAYSSSKGAVITLAELLAEEYKETGPSFNALALGAVQTEMLAEAFPGYEAPTTAAQMGAYVLQFALEGHHYYNGKVLPVANSTP